MERGLINRYTWMRKCYMNQYPSIEHKDSKLQQGLKELTANSSECYHGAIS